MAYIIGIDQSTQGTKAMLFDEAGTILLRTDKAHAQMIDENGWVEHDPEEIYENTIAVVKALLEQSGVDRNEIRAIGISNQRETALAWNKETKKPIYPAIVWQCARGAAICAKLEQENPSAPALIQAHTGIPMSPYFSAAKLSWIMKNVEGAYQLAEEGKLCCGTIDSWLVFRMTQGEEFRTDYSNASRTQLYHITELCWDKEICEMFGIPMNALAEVTDSDGLFGMTDLEGLLPKEVPIHGVMGDSHGALFGQGCHKKGMMKATYGTGSSIMMNIGEKAIFSKKGLATSFAWKIDGSLQYVLEGNINYTGAVVTWMKDQLGLITSAGETAQLAKEANPSDHTYLIPAFSGLGAPYWRSDVEACFVGMGRNTGRKELVRAGIECIAYQIADVVGLMKEEADIEQLQLRVDGGPTKNEYLMQFQSDLLDCPVSVPHMEELSGIGAAYAAGFGVGLYQKEIFEQMKYRVFTSKMEAEKREEKKAGWKTAIDRLIGA